MNIVHVTPWYLPRLGGVETHVHAIAQEMRADGHRVRVVTGQHKPGHRLEHREQGVKVTRIPFQLFRTGSSFGGLSGQSNLNNIGAKSRFKLGLWQWMVDHRHLFTRADIVHVHDVFWWMLPLFPMIAPKTFVTFHGWEGVYPVPTRNKLVRWTANQLARGSIHVGDWIREFYWERPDAVTYGAPTISRKPRGVKTGRNHYVFVGRLVRENELKLYLRLMTALKRERPRTTITWVGDGPFRAECERLGRVTGWTDDIARHLATAEVVLANSYLSIWQALKLGKPVVAFHSHPLKRRYLETFPGHQYLVTGGRVGAVRKQLSQLGANLDEDPKMGAAMNPEMNPAKIKAFTRDFTWAEVTKTYYQLWER